MVPCHLTPDQQAEQIEWILVAVEGSTPTEIDKNARENISFFCDHPNAMACVQPDIDLYLDRAPTISFRVHLPQWTPPEGVSPRTVDYWNYTIKNLCTHELAHVEIGLEWRRYVEGELRPQFAPYPQLLEPFRIVAMQAYKKAQATYDEVTRHGRIVPPWKPPDSPTHP